jgi:hypothetical protein
VVIGLKVKPDAPDQAGCLVALSGVDDEAGGLVEDEELVVFVDNIKERFRQARILLLHYWRKLNSMHNSRMKLEKVKLLTTQDGTHIDYIEPSVVCAAQHALDILEREEGCVHAIEGESKTIWRLESEKPRVSMEKLEELAQGVCVR